MRPDRWLIAAIILGFFAATLAWAAGPRPARLGTDTIGDVALAGSVRDRIGDPAGYRDLAVALVEDGQVRFAGLGGGEGTAPGPDTAFEIGSVGKALTGMLLAELVAGGAVRDDAPLRELLPAVGFEDPELAETTLAELASHRAGLPRLRITGVGQLLGIQLRMLGGKDPYAGQDLDWLMSTVAGTSVAAGEPTIRYSNYGFAVLGHALAAHTGTPYPQLLTARILEPLGMRATGFHLDGAPPPAPRVDGATAAGRAVEPWQGSGYAPAGIGAWSTAADLAKLVAAMLDGTAPGADAATPRFDRSADRRVGYGWFTDRRDGQEITWHNGGTGGFSSFVGFDRDAGRGVVVLGNTDLSVDGIGWRLLGAEVDNGGSGGAAGGLGLLRIAATVLLSLAGGLSLLHTATRARADRLRLVSNGVLAIALPALAYPVGAWLAVPTWVWAAGAGLSAAAVVLAVRRWRGAPYPAGRFTWLRWSSTTVVTLALAGVVVWLYL